MNCLIKHHTVKSCTSKFLVFLVHCDIIHISTKETKKKKMIWKAKDLEVHENSYTYRNASTAYLTANKMTDIESPVSKDLMEKNKKLKLN